MSLYNSYRPKDFRDLVGQDFIRTALLSALKHDQTVGAYLFAGPRGTGKTSTARIFAKALECTNRDPSGNPCGTCTNCTSVDSESFIDIIEIDAASHTGVDDMRDLIDRTQFQPTEGRYKVYIIDEVHMLSKPAFNTLLKTLEEPPAHVKFILATTELHKVLETIVSRTQHYDFVPIGLPAIIARLRYIADTEGIIYESEAIELIARSARGGLRDAITLLEQQALFGTITRTGVEETLGIPARDTLERLLDAVESDTIDLTPALDRVRAGDGDVRRCIEELLYLLRDRIAEATRTDPKNPNIARLYDLFRAATHAYERARYVPDGWLLLEMTIREWLWRENTTPIAPTPRKVSVPKVPVEVSKPSPKQAIHLPESVPTTPPNPSTDTVTVVWPPVTFSYADFIERILKIPNRAFVAMGLKTSDYRIDENTFIVLAENDFTRGKLDTPDVRAFLNEQLKLWFATPMNVRIERSGIGVGARPTQSGLAEVAMDIF